MSRVIFCLLGAALLVGGCDRQSKTPEQASGALPGEASGEASSEAKAPVTGAFQPGAFDRTHKGAAQPSSGFFAPDGTPANLALLRGRPVLLNLWATWCAPCLREMPALDALAASDPDVQVVTISQDSEGAAKVKPWFTAHGYKALKPWTDPKTALSIELAANLPTTILYDSAGKEVWRVTGPRDWTDAESRKALKEAR